mgnify:CR=1 FL=1
MYTFDQDTGEITHFTLRFTLLYTALHGRDTFRRLSTDEETGSTRENIVKIFFYNVNKVKYYIISHYARAHY